MGTIYVVGDLYCMCISVKFLLPMAHIAMLLKKIIMFCTFCIGGGCDDSGSVDVPSAVHQTSHQMAHLVQKNTVIRGKKYLYTVAHI